MRHTPSPHHEGVSARTDPRRTKQCAVHVARRVSSRDRLRGALGFAAIVVAESVQNQSKDNQANEHAANDPR